VEEVDGAPSKEDEKPCHYIVQTDEAESKDRTDIGWITVRPESRFEHWVKLPDGQFRKRYKSREISQADMELLYAFDALPRLKVDYRPVAKFLKDNNGLIWCISLLIFILYAICGLVMMVANQFGFSMAIIDSNVTAYIFIPLLVLLPISIACTYKSNMAGHTWKNLTPDDFAADKEAEAVRQMKKKMAAELAAHTANSSISKLV